MIKEISLNDLQRVSLTQKIEDIFDTWSGTEVHGAQDEEDCKKVFVSYENTDNKVVQTAIYCNFTIRVDRVEDFIVI